MNSEDDGYTHTPGSVGGESDGDGDGGGPSGTLLVAVVALATLVIPGVIYLYPTLLADHVPFMVAMLALPFVPALLLGIVGVWAMKDRRFVDSSVFGVGLIVDYWTSDRDGDRNRDRDSTSISMLGNL